MSKPSDGRFDEQQQEHINRSNPSTATPEEITSPQSTTEAPNPVTPAEYIYNSMIPPTSPNLPSPETVEVGVSLAGKRERCNTGDSSASGSGPASQSQPMMSMDLNFLNPDEIMLDGGLSALGVGRLKSSDYVEDFLLPDTAATAACALEAEHEQPPPPPQDQMLAEQPPPPQDQMISSTSTSSRTGTEKKNEFCPILTLTARLERITTGEEIAPLSENFRLSSKDWVQDFAAESADLGPTHPSLFMGQSNANAAVGTQHQQQQPQQQQPHTGLSAEMGRVGTGDSGVWVQDFVAESVDSAPMYPNMFEQHPAGQVSTPDDVTPLPFKTPSQSYDEYQVPLQPLDHRPAVPPPMPPTPSRNNNTNVVHNLPPLTARPVAKGTSPASSTTSLTSKKKRKKKRTIDESRAVEPTDNDVLFGRGGYTNTHIGNINFRKRAMELRPWYEQASTSKEEKYRISDLLVESVKSEGHRFLEKGEGGLWHEVIGNGARKKASQALRERIKGSRKAAGGNASSIKSAGSAGAGNVNVDEAIGDIAPASVGDVIGV